MKAKNKKIRYFLHGIILLYGIACLWLYYHQSVADFTDGSNILYQADLPLHISMVVEDGWYYSFTAFAYQALYLLFGGSTIGIAVMLAVFSVATVYAAEALICYLGHYKGKDAGTLLMAITVNFVMPIYVYDVGRYRYVSYQSANIWHNSTYICMRLFALLTFLMYFKLEEKYREGLSVKEWLAFALLNVITTGIKPSFLLAFSPIMGIFLLADLFERVPFKRIFIFGSAMLPSGLVILWQNAVLFGEDTGNGMEFSPWYTFSMHADQPKMAVILSVLFCMIVILVTLKDILKEKNYLFILLMTALGFLEALCMVESGSRSVDGNFLWGYSFCIFVLFLYTAVKCFQYPTGLKAGGGRLAIREASASQIVRLAVKAVMVFLYAWHLYCGLYFFIRLVCGESYWMVL